MSRTCSLLLALLGLLWSTPVPAAQRPTRGDEPASPALEAFQEWWSAFLRDTPERLSAGEELELLGLVQGLEEMARERPALDRSVNEALLDLAGLGLTDELPTTSRKGPHARVHSLAQRSLVRRLESDESGGRRAHVFGGVLAGRSRHPHGRRMGALALADELRGVQALMGVLTVAGDRADPMRRACLPLLPEWPHELSDRFLVEELSRPYVHGEPHPFTQLLGRVRRHEQPLAPAAAELLAQRLPLQLIHSDWRASSRAIELSRGLEPAQIVPHLIESLAVWDNRESLGRGSRRIAEEIMRELQRLSGRSMGRSPARWNAWWQAVQDGTIELATESGAPVEARTSAQFFGLRPITDRVTFVIDRSGSMEQPWGTTNHSRYEEAVEQMLRFLQACGPRTRFNVVLFSSSPIRSSRGLVEATDTNLESARSSILGRAPDGGTFLRPAIQTAMAIGSDGLPELERLEADTIVVLCDGETEEGAAWVGPFLERANALARVRFHCVLIGSSGDGTLEALAERTGGDFIRTGG